MDSRHCAGCGRPAWLRSNQAVGSWTASPADGGVSEGSGGQYGGSGQGRTGKLSHRPVSPGRYASHDDIRGHEYVIMPETTYILIGGEDHFRRIFTDGRDWPTDVEPTYAGYSIGRWIDEDHDG